MGSIETMGVLAGGVIGSGWVGRAAMCGMRVCVYDESVGVRDGVAEALEHAERSYRRLTLAPLSSIGEVIFVDSLKDLAERSDFIQENLPEDLALKRRVLCELSRYCGSDVLVASSTSGLSPSLLQLDMEHAGNFLVGHPFNPVYLMPLVELCGGDKTEEKTLTLARQFYDSLGMHPLVLKKEVSGFIADRLMEALWREALWMVHDGMADVGDIDDALRFGPGLRWSFMGSFLTYRLAGGSGGMAHFLKHFEPSLEWDWTRLKAPAWSNELAAKIVEQSDEQAAGLSPQELHCLRDDCLVSVLQALRSQDYGAGQTLKKLEAILFEKSHKTGGDEELDLREPLILHRATVLPEWIDYNGHMNESRYLQVFGDASDALYRHVGCGQEYHKLGFSYYTAETHLRHLSEASAGTLLHVSTRVIDMDDKKLRFFHELYDSGGGELLATCEQMAVHVDTGLGRASAVDGVIRGKLFEIYEAHQNLERPLAVGRAVGDKHVRG